MFRILRKLILFSLLLVTLIGLYIYQSTVIPLKDTLLANDTDGVNAVQCVTHSPNVPLDRHGYLDIAIWNIYKQQNEGWQNVLKQLADRTDLLLLQEATLTDDLKALINEQKQGWVLAKAFIFGGEPVGVMNLSQDYPLSTCAFRYSEPLIQYPKSLLVSYYLLSDNSQLLVANIHSINFTLGLEEYRAQLNVVAAAISEHKGPVILAGDLNTWSRERGEYIATMARNAALTEAVPNDDSRTTIFGQSLDHIFYRDLQLVKTESIVTDSSDHHPLKAYFRLLKKIP
ncbi:endonuclease/exonuclease/phosphatase family protein [Shewanella sp. GutDb-MelDb]|jgi:endonuclease/exonuclease/phosphatase (EEP) superfamily protein YafD|uniref:endonuclease/exonuclease/phosphatase family protein n=1 Tax=Shewanella sp. GutDb-MelDb TaxID=2058316 RepID=UPI000C7D308C|nr:endonuclease/exonuclease/phosphatase family protein [Shewanella sp. GutDb-MelDb]PKG57447.1 EEP domain-containing protein [Shewanella sp. GutDb-MelDb]